MVGYASSRAHNNNNDTNTNINTNYNKHNKTSRSGLAFRHKLKHGLQRCTCRSCFQNSKGVLKTIAQGVRIEGGLCEFAGA
jgi:hypothetical protein